MATGPRSRTWSIGSEPLRMSLSARTHRTAAKRPLDNSPWVPYYSHRMTPKSVASFRLDTKTQEGLEHLSKIRKRSQGQIITDLVWTEMHRAGFHPDDPKERNQMLVEIRTKDGKLLPIVNHNGERFCAALKDAEYSIRLVNDSSHRRLAVISVDGINAVNGKDAGYDGPGWVLDPWQSANILGWYRNSEEVAAFKFGAVGGSYAAQTGRGESNVGIIGVAVFEELVRLVTLTTTPYWVRHDVIYDMGVLRSGTPSAASDSSRLYCGDEIRMVDGPPSGIYACCASMDSATPTAAGPTVGVASAAAAADDSAIRSVDPTTPKTSTRLRRAAADLGTEYGSKTKMRTGTCDFEKASTTPVEVIKIRYASEEILRSWGVPVGLMPSTTPEAFPANAGVRPPPGWTG